ncbi:hypothetical protein [Mariniluteicoccus endophyticus]
MQRARRWTPRRPTRAYAELLEIIGHPVTGSSLDVEGLYGPDELGEG